MGGVPRRTLGHERIQRGKCETAGAVTLRSVHHGRHGLRLAAYCFS